MKDNLIYNMEREDHLIVRVKEREHLIVKIKWKDFTKTCWNKMDLRGIIVASGCRWRHLIASLG